jgi:hypothetical protein
MGPEGGHDNVLSLYNRFGVDPQGNILIAANPT